MKRTNKQSANGTAANGTTGEMLPHYDFSSGVRGKHYKKYREGVTVELLGESAQTRFVALDDDLGKIFPDSKSVNNALRHIVEALPKAKRKRAA